MSSSDHGRFIAHIPLFKGLSPAQSAEIARSFRLENIPEGTELCKEGEAGAEVFVVEQGRVDILKRTSGGDSQLVAELVAPTVVGEMSLLDSAPRSATVVAAARLTAYSFEVAYFEKLLEQGNAAAFGIVRNLTRMLCERLRQTNERIDGFFSDPHKALEEIREQQRGVAWQRVHTRGGR